MNHFVTGAVLLVAAFTIVVAEDIAAPCRSIPFCLQCTIGTIDVKPKCLQCELDYGIDKNDRCTDCKLLTGCWRCNTTQFCTRCKYSSDGADYNGQGSCSPCAPNCRTCKTYGSGTCDRCKSGYILTEERQCESCPDFCSKCEPAMFNTLRCIHCNPGYTKDSSSGSTKCSPCGAKCRSCSVSGPNKCDICEDGFSLTNGNQCSRSSLCESNCQVCFNGRCIRCKDRNEPVDGSCAGTRIDA